MSARQKQVLELLAAGEPRKRIADQLGISINTVKKHAKAAFKKLGAGNAAGAVKTYYARHD